MTTASSTSSFSGRGNQGLQLGSNSGNIYANFGGQPGKPVDSSLRRSTHGGCWLTSFLRLAGEPPPKPLASSTVPFRRDPDFVDRDIFAQIEEQCSKPASRAALVGLGGVGKSQLAIEYSYRVQETSPQSWVFWVYAGNKTRFEESYRIVADRVKLSRRDEPDVDIFRLVSNWLCNEANGRWLMILDNADDPDVFFHAHEGGWKTDTDDSTRFAVSLSAFLPQTQNGSILVTSRNRDAASRLTGSDRDIIAVDPMDEGQALRLLTKKVHGEFDNGDARRLLQALDYMPLAISQAAAYINQGAPRITVTKYLENVHKNERNKARLLDTDVGDLRRDGSAVHSISMTWQISFEYIRQQRPSAARLLSFMSLFDRQGIPASLLHHHYEDDSSELDANHDDDPNVEDDSEMEFEDDVCTLRNYSLIRTRDTAGEWFEMHRLVQLSTRRWLELHGNLERWKKKYILNMWETFPPGQYENWTTCQALFPHAQAVLAYRPATNKYIIYWTAILTNAGWYARAKGDYLTAEEMNRRALEAREKVLGVEHHSTLISVSNLASIFQYQGKYEAAEEMSRRALEGSEKVLGVEHPSTLIGVSNLALLLQYQGKYEAAEEMNRRALEGSEKVLGAEHPSTLIGVSNLALVLQYQGKYEAAEEMNRRALEGSEKVLGAEHPSTLIGVSNLASVLQFQGKYEAAEEMNRRVLEGKEKVLGAEHPETLIGVSNLASVLQYQGKYESAKEMSRRALEGKEKVLGVEHPETLTTVSNLALVLQYQGKYEAAEEMNRRALEGKEKVLGVEHPSTLISVDNVAAMLRHQGKYEAAEEMNRRALKGREKVLGVDHPDTLTSVYNLAYLFHLQQRYDDASILYCRASAGFRKTLGPDHPTTQKCSQHHSSMIHEMKT